MFNKLTLNSILEDEINEISITPLFGYKINNIFEEKRIKEERKFIQTYYNQEFNKDELLKFSYDNFKFHPNFKIIKINQNYKIIKNTIFWNFLRYIKMLFSKS